MAKNEEQQAIAYIDEEFKTKLDKIREKNKEDPEHYLNKLELKQIYIFSILIAIRDNLRPKKSKKKAWIIRTSYLKDEDNVILRSLIFNFTKNIKILLPDNSSEFYEICEELANAGMNKMLDMLENSKEVEETILLESRKFKN